ncbi:MAG: GntR family transcriptional regulator [Verrucomicrobiaceae bacterium]|nr:GntR family transcriptional regulator [Verrucomicrobiaceae bacterium]
MAASSTISLRQQAYDHLQRKLISGELRSGSVVSEQSLAEEIGVSRTPVREAIRTLEMEGILEQVPRFGTVVRKLDRRDLVELYELREAIEPFSTARAARRISASDLSNLESTIQAIEVLRDELGISGARQLNENQMRRLLSADLTFHLTLLRASGNGRMLKIVSDSRLLTGVFNSRRQPHTSAVVESTLDQHRAIVAAVQARNEGMAASAMLSHILHSKEQALEAFDFDMSSPSVPASTQRIISELTRKPRSRK